MLGADLIALFTDAALGTFGEQLFHGSKAVPKSGSVLVVVDTLGHSALRIHNQRQPAIHRPTAQVSARATTRPAAESLARQAYTACFEVLNQTVNGRFYLAMTPQQEPFDMGTDTEGRIKYAFNVLGEARG